MLDHTAAVRSASARVLELVRGTPADAEIRSCPGWTDADLTWHLTAVALLRAVVADLVDAPESVAKPDRPNDADLPAFIAERSQRLGRGDGRRRDRRWRGGVGARSRTVQGTSPRSGTTHDDPAVCVIDDAHGDGSRFGRRSRPVAAGQGDARSDHGRLRPVRCGPCPCGSPSGKAGAVTFDARPSGRSAREPQGRGGALAGGRPRCSCSFPS